MRRKLLSILALLCLTVVNAWGVRVKVYKPGDTFDIGEAYICLDDQQPGSIIHTAGVNAVVPNFVYDKMNNKWSFEKDWIPCSGSDDSEENIVLTPLNDTTPGILPLGVRVKSGSAHKKTLTP